MLSKTPKKIIYRIWSPIVSWRRSITGRLALLYTLSAFGTLTLATAFLYWELRTNFELDENQFLADKINVIRVILSNHPSNPQALEEEVKLEEAAHKFSTYYSRVLDEKRHTLIETPHMANIFSKDLFPQPIGLMEKPVEGIKWKSPNGNFYLLMAAWAELDHSPGEKRLLQLALDVSKEETLIDDYRRKVIAVILIGVLFSTGAGLTIARKGMQPLREITSLAQRITAVQLRERIDALRWPRELKDLATAFDEMLNRLEGSFTQLSQFSADLAHELRTPINNLLGEAEVALYRSRSPDEYRQVIESSLEEYARLSRMIDSLLFLARAECKDTQINRCVLDAHAEIEVVREFHEAFAEEKGINVVCDGNARLNADSILFRRAVSNLISNSLHYTLPGGKVTLCVKQLDGHCVEVIVSDTGFGIEPEHLPKIFDRFYRTNLARSQCPQGSGLGLALVKSIMDLHGGTVAIQSVPSMGTMVILRFSQQT
jgi:two-component system, OmpR family, heavy metal sensor histidine kinase CusS